MMKFLMRLVLIYKLITKIIDQVEMIGNKPMLKV